MAADSEWSGKYGTLAPEIAGQVWPKLPVIRTGSFSSTEYLGNGAYGEVYSFVKDGVSSALKIMKPLYTTPIYLEKMMMAMSAYSQLHTEDGVIPETLGIPDALIYVIDDAFMLPTIPPGSTNPPVSRSSGDEVLVGLVMPLIKGTELFEIISKDPLDGRRARKLASDLLSAVAFMASKGVAHRDIKPENVIVTKHRGVELFTLVDFDFACFLDDCRDKFGTFAYLAPEILGTQMRSGRLSIEHVKYYYGTDVWATGVLLHVALMGTFPYNTPGGAYATEEAIRRLPSRYGAGSLITEESALIPILNPFDPSFTTVIQDALVISPDARKSASELLLILDGISVPGPAPIPDALTWTTRDITLEAWSEAVGGFKVAANKLFAIPSGVDKFESGAVAFSFELHRGSEKSGHRLVLVPEGSEKQFPDDEDVVNPKTLKKYAKDFVAPSRYSVRLLTIAADVPKLMIFAIRKPSGEPVGAEFNNGFFTRILRIVSKK